LRQRFGQSRAADAGLAHLENGGDFADGAVTFEGDDLGADTFVSVGRSAVKLALAQGAKAKGL